MAIGTYGQLKTAVASWLARSDLTTIIPDLVLLAEANIRRDVRCRAMEQQATGTLTATTLALPTRFLEARRVALGDDTQRYVTPEEFSLIDTDDSDRYTIIGENFHFQSSTSDYTIDYWQSFAAFSADGDTNWLLTNAPEVYLFGTLAESADYLRGKLAPMGPVWRDKYLAAVRQLNATERRARFPGPLVVRSEVKER